MPAESWVRIAVAVPIGVVRYLAAQTDFIIRRYGADVWHFALPAVHAIDSERSGRDAPALTEARLAPFRLLVEANRPRPGRGMATVPVFMTAVQWRDVRTVAARLGCGESALIRAGLAQRMRTLIEFHENIRTGAIPSPQ